MNRLVTIPGLPTEASVSAPPPTIDGVKLLHRRILAALAALRGARDAHSYCPSVENWNNVAAAERHLDYLLADQRIRRQKETT